MEYGCPSVSYRVDVAHSFIPVLSALQRLPGKRVISISCRSDKLWRLQWLVCYFSRSCFLLVPCSCSWLDCFCCSCKGVWGLNQGTTFLVQGFLSWTFSWHHSLGFWFSEYLKKKPFMCFATPCISLSPLVAVFKMAGISLGSGFQKFLLH